MPTVYQVLFSQYELRRLRIAGNWNDENEYIGWLKKHGLIEHHLYSEDSLVREEQVRIHYYGIYSNSDPFRAVGYSTKFKGKIEVIVLSEILLPAERVRAELEHLLYARYHDLRKMFPGSIFQKAIDKAVESNSFQETFSLIVFEEIKNRKSIDSKGKIEKIHDEVYFLAKELSRVLGNSS